MNVVSPGGGPETPPRTCWIVTDGAAGAENQCLGLAEALGLAPSAKRIEIRAPWRWLPPDLCVNPFAALSGEGDILSPPWPDIVIGSGRKAVAPVAAVGRATNGAAFTVQIQDPRGCYEAFDAIVSPEHDALQGDNVIQTLGSLHRVTPARLATARAAVASSVAALPAPRFAVLVGGRSRGYDLSAARAERLGRDLADLCARTGGSVMVTTSRRTPAKAGSALRATLQGQSATVWQPDVDPEPNPYFGFLALADEILVTADSVTMLSEAASTERPLHILPVEGGRTKFGRFHRALVEQGYARWFDGECGQKPVQQLQETQRVAAELQPRIARKLPEGAAVVSE